MTARAPLLPLALATCLSCGLAAQAPSAAEIATFDRELPKLLVKYRVAGLGAALIRDGRVVWTGEYGLQGPDQPATRATLFNVASMAKPISAETILRLVAAGLLSLDEPMATAWVDPDVAADPRHSMLTARLALSHQAGFLNWRRMNQGGRLAFVFDPGTRFGYSGEGYNYAARYAEKRTGLSFEALADHYIFRPFGLRTARDYATFLIGAMNGDGLPPALARERFHTQVDIAAQWPCVAKPADLCPTRSGSALGWFRFDYGSEPVIWHGGDDRGEHSLASFYPDTRDGVVVLINGGSGRFAVTDALDLLDSRSPISRFAAVRRSRSASGFAPSSRRPMREPFRAQRRRDGLRRPPLTQRR